METIVTVDLDGNLKYLVNEVSAGAFPDAQEPRRASHVVPLDPRARFWFQALRRAFGEDSWVGKWTRRWRGPWLVDLSPVGGEVYGAFETRDAAITFEVEWLNQFFL